MNIAILRSELTDDPAGLGYASQSDADVAVTINNANRDYLAPISSLELLRWGMGSGRLDALANAIQTGPEAVRSIARGLQYVLERSDSDLDFNDANEAAMVDGLVAAGVLSADDKTTLRAMATKQRSRAEEIGLGRVRPGDVQKARS